MIKTKINKKVKEGNIGMFFGKNSQNSPNKQVLDMLNDQIKKKKSLQKIHNEEYKKIFIKNYFETYQKLQKETKLMLKLFYSKFPFNLEKDYEKVMSIVKRMKFLKNDIKSFIVKIKGKIEKDKFQEHIKPLEVLLTLISHAFVKIGSLRPN